MTTNLSRADARRRTAALAIASYEVEVDLSECTDPARTTYPTRSTISLSSTESDTFLDFIGESVESVEIDGEPRPFEYDGARIQVRGLRTDGPSTVTVRAHARYSRSGEGLHRYVDPADGRTYLYTQYEPSDSRRVFPNCEQPDLKARFSFVITAPTEWEVLSNQPEVDQEDTGVNAAGLACSRRTYAQTPPMSTYLTCIVAGPYRRWSDEWAGTVPTTDGGTTNLTIPLGVLCRQSLAADFDPEEFLEVTKQGLGYFHELVHFPYPWGKYDQVLVPEYNLGAMENPGLVTFTDAGYVFQSGSTRSDHESRAETILHEMSHMWFGDLVTPQWWDDLWTKESFADYLGTAATAESTRFTDAWTAFCARRKAWAYRADQLPTTHPVVADIPDVEAATQNFDGITYAKGASVVRQLVAYVGREAFAVGLRRYFAKHAWGNTALADLLVELEAASGRDLREWSRLWLETSGVNTLTPRLEIGADGRIAALQVEQGSAPEGVAASGPYDGGHGEGILRPHRLVVGLYARDGGVLRRMQRFELDVVGELTAVPGAVGCAAPDLVVVNDEEWTFAKMRLDERSLATALESLTSLESSLTRGGVWAALWNACRDGLLPAGAFVEAVLRHAPHEDDIALASMAMRQAVTAARDFAPAGERAELLRRVVEASWQRMAEVGAEADQQLAWARTLAEAALSCDARADDVRRLLDGDVTVPGLVVGPELRWELWRGLAATGHAGEGELAVERAADGTSLAPVRHRCALASLPTPAAKKAAFEAVLQDLTLTNDMVSAAASGFSTPGQDALRAEYAEPYFAALTSLWGDRSMGLAKRAVQGLFPGAGEAQVGLPLAAHPVPAQAQAWLDTYPDAPAALRRLIVEARDDVLRVLRAQGARD